MPYTDSEPVTAELDLLGVWIMDVESGGADSARQFPYGASQRDDQLNMMGQATYYAGRTDPVTDYGEHEAYSIGVVIDVPHGTTWRDDLDVLYGFAEGRRILHFRDNRGRAAYGVMENFRRTDRDWGTQVAFSLERRSYVLDQVSV